MFDINSKFTLDVPGRPPLKLGPGDYVTTGGEGHIYHKGVGIKIWIDPDRAARDRMPDKIPLLAKLKHPWIVVPESIALDTNGRAVGFAMPWVDNSWHMPLAFTNDWRAANSFGDAEALAFAGKMREVVTFVHGKGAILGDANELNILGVGREPRYIDTDPWVLPGYPGHGILPTIHDWHAGEFTREADWFAWAVVTFQLLTGTHPYRGTHPGFKRNDLEGRMRANASVFGRDIRLSAAVRPFSCIPAPLFDWYHAVFEDGFRGLPPEPLASPILAAPGRRAAAAPAGGSLSVTELYRLPGGVLRAVAPDIVMLAGGLLVSLPDGRAFGTADPAAAFMRLPGGTVAGILAGQGRLGFGLLRAAPGAAMAMQDTGLAASMAWPSENRLFALVHDGLLEVKIHDLGARQTALPGRKWSLNPNATVFGDGIAVYDALGAKFLVAPFGATAVAVVRCRELDGLKTVSMVRRGRIAVMSLLDRAGSYKRASLLFTDDYAGCQVTVSDADDGMLTDVITDGGVVVRFTAEGKLELAMPATGARREADPGGLAEGRLLAGPSGVFCVDAGRICKLSLS